jgi:tetratricopeptide (TPR) repeat protein
MRMSAGIASHSEVLDMTLSLRILSIATAMVMTACATQTSRSSLGQSGIEAGALLDSSPLMHGAEALDLYDAKILDVTPDMAEFIGAHISERSAEYTKVRQLLFSVMGNGHFDLVYDDKTRTAAETFRDHRGNCLSFTTLFVAMARHVGLDAYFQEIQIPPDWSIAGDALLLSLHVNVFLDMKGYSDRVVDFNSQVVHFYIHDLKPNYKRRVISDERARAHYFNNIGVEHMLLGGDTLTALSNLQQSIREDEAFAPAWISLGILHRREGYLDYAEAAYLQALKVDEFNLVAMSNLASLYEEEGLIRQAEHYRQMVQTHRMKNPYYRYFLARSAVIDGDYRVAIDHLKHAIARSKEEHLFYFLLSTSYLMLGEKEESQRWLQKAEELAGEGPERQRYHHKLERLMDQDKTP